MGESFVGISVISQSFVLFFFCFSFSLFSQRGGNMSFDLYLCLVIFYVPPQPLIILLFHRLDLEMSNGNLPH